MAGCGKNGFRCYAWFQDSPEKYTQNLIIRTKTKRGRSILLSSESACPSNVSTFRLALALVTMGYWLATCLLHLEISIIIVSPMSTPLGTITPSEYSSAVGWVVLLGAAVLIALQAKNGQSRGRTLLYWLLWLTAVYFANKTLVFSPNEYIHYPQYAILTILMVLCLDPKRTLFPFGRILFWATLMGILDEMNQYFFLCPSYGEYIDFNDFFLNELGAVAGLLLAYGFRRPVTNARALVPVHKTMEFRLVTGCVAILLILHLGGRLNITPTNEIPPGGIAQEGGKRVVYLERKPGIMGTWQNASSGGAYYVLSPISGLILMLVTGSVFLLFDPRVFRQVGIRLRFAKYFDK